MLQNRILTRLASHKYMRSLIALRSVLKTAGIKKAL